MKTLKQIKDEADIVVEKEISKKKYKPFGSVIQHRKMDEKRCAIANGIQLRVYIKNGCCPDKQGNPMIIPEDKKKFYI